MADCFCGCHRKIGATKMSLKSANGVGRQAADTADGLRETVEPLLVENPHNATAEQVAGMRDTYERHRRECEDAASTCRDVVHGDRAFSEVDWPVVRKKVKDASGMLSRRARRKVRRPSRYAGKFRLPALLVCVRGRIRLPTPRRRDRRRGLHRRGAGVA